MNVVLRMLRRCPVAIVVAAAVLGLGVTPAGRAIPTAEPAAEASQPCDPAVGQMRAVWISTVSNIDWPSRPGLSVAEQQQEYRAILDNAVALRLNTVLVQVRPTADALWPSPYEPWSQWLTGTQGQDPGYDPLAFLVAEAHARGLQFHAWFNPYRVSKQDDSAQLVPEHPARVHPDWVLGYGGQLYYDPGIPDVREFVLDAVLDAVQRYDVDAVHFDDYFYPYPAGSEQIPDAATFARYGGAFTDVADWRRDNVNQLVRAVRGRIDAVKPGVEFGISPFGVWRNVATDPRGSATTALESYSATYADSHTWVTQGWVDYVVPQIYWEIGHGAADYAALVPWWSNLVAGTRVQLYVGQGAYKVGSTVAWDDAELAEHLTFNQQHPQVRGDIYFSAASLTSNAAGAISRVAAEHYPQPVPAPCSRGG